MGRYRYLIIIKLKKKKIIIITVSQRVVVVDDGREVVVVVVVTMHTLTRGRYSRGPNHLIAAIPSPLPGRLHYIKPNSPPEFETV